MMATSIRSLRQSLVQAKRHSSPQLLEEIVHGLRDLGQSGYRCCLLDFESCRPAFYVRVLGFERSRIKVELEFPIEPRLRSVQWLPLSHLADYDEVEDVEGVRRIYEDVSPYVRERTANLQLMRGRRARHGANGRPPRNRSSSGRRRPRFRGRRRPASHVLWWCVAGLLLTMSLAVFVTA